MATDYTDELKASMQEQAAPQGPPANNAATAGAPAGQDVPSTGDCGCQSPSECHCQIRFAEQGGASEAAENAGGQA